MKTIVNEIIYILINVKTYRQMAKNLLTILYNNFGPHHLARIAAAMKISKVYGFEVVGIELANRELIYPWDRDANISSVTKYTLFAAKAVEEISATALVHSMWSILNNINPQALAVGLSKPAIPAMLTALIWARLNKRIAVQMRDTKIDDHYRNPLKEWIKSKIAVLFDAALVAGTSSKAYMEKLGLTSNRIFLGADVVDNDYFAKQADWAKGNAAHLSERYRLPESYFLCVCRFLEGKNLPRLLEAYAGYSQASGARAWELVLCGSGPLEYQLKQQAIRLGIQEQVRFPGFIQIGELPVYYGLARCLIMPSLGDTWGLVVNEAMASGLPVLVSLACGCAPDLVQEGINGYSFDPCDEKSLTKLLLKISSDDLALQGMGEASRRIIANWGLDLFARNLLAAVAAS